MILLQNNRSIRKKIDWLQIKFELLEELLIAICVTKTLLKPDGSKLRFQLKGYKNIETSDRNKMVEV